MDEPGEGGMRVAGWVAVAVSWAVPAIGVDQAPWAMVVDGDSEVVAANHRVAPAPPDPTDRFAFDVPPEPRACALVLTGVALLLLRAARPRR